MALLTSRGYGRKVGLQVHSAAAGAVLELLPFWWAGEEVEPERTWEVPTIESAERVVREMELWVAEHAVDRVFVHAAVVVVGDRALLLPGRSMAGKTTLTASLLRAGARYGSDEYAVLDARGLVDAYPRPLSIRSGSNGATRSRVPAAHFGASVMTHPVAVSMIAAVWYSPGARWQPRSLSPAMAVLRLLDNTVSAQTRPAAALHALSIAVAGAVSIEGARDDADAAAVALLGLLA